MHASKNHQHFSGLAAGYSKYRPSYPSALFNYLHKVTPQCEWVWDCGTGTGQVAAALSTCFNQVLASDSAQEQIQHAQFNQNIYYHVARAEHCALANQSVGLVTVAQALHWMKLDAFYAEVNRVLQPGGIIAVWSYNLFSISPVIDTIIHQLYADILQGYWPPERKLVEQSYASLPFPYETLVTPTFKMQAQWDFTHLLGYLQTWTAVKRYRQAQHKNPLNEVEVPLRAAWGDEETVRNVWWPLTLKVGRF